jgi:CHAT domain-containing protein/tetratricopeptide (TPR) repeat protein
VLADSGGPLLLRLAGGESKSIRIPASAGEYLQVVAASDPQLVVKTSLYDSTGALVAVTPSLGGTGGDAEIAAYAETTGDFRLRIASQMLSAELRTCTITLMVRRAASPADRTDAEAHRAFAKAVAQAAQGPKGMRAAVALLDEPVDLARRAGDTVLELRAIFGKGQFLAMLGEFQSSLPFFEQSLELGRKAGNQRAEAHTLDDMGLVYADLERYSDAIERYNRALELQRQTAQPWETALTLSNLADAESAVGRMDIALDCLQRQERIRKDLSDEFGLSETWLGMADVYLMMGAPELALEKLIDTLPHWRPFRAQEDGKESEIAAYRNLGRAYAAIGNYGSAEAALVNAMKLARALGNRRITADILVVEAQLSPLRGDRDRSVKAAGQALAASRAAEYRRGEALALIELGKLRMGAGQVRSAVPQLQQALDIATQLGQPYDEANARRVLGMAQVALGEHSAASEEFMAALAIQRRIGDRFGEVQTLVEAGRLQESTGRLDRALATLEQALEVIDRTRSSLAAPELRASYLASQRAAYELAVRVLIRLHQKHPGGGYDVRAFNVSERAHARTLLDALGNAHATPDREADRGVSVRLNALDASLHLLASSEQSRHRDERIAALLTSRNQLELEAQLQRTADSNRANESIAPLPLQAIREQLLAVDTVLLEYLTGPQQSHLWVASRDGLHHYALPGEDAIRVAVRGLYRSLTAADRLPPNLGIAQRHAVLAAADGSASHQAEDLARTLLPIAPSLLGKGSILIVGDGPIQLVPFALLPAPGDPAHILADAHNLAVEPSASVLAQMRRSRAPVTGGRVLVVADPVYSLSDPRFPIVPQPASAALALAGYRPFIATPLDRRLKSLPALPMSRVEAERLVALAPGRATTLLDFDATPAAFKHLAENPFSIIHIATHTLLDDRYPDLSGLVLSLVDRKGRPIDGFVPLLDIYQMRLHAHLVVLSACETYIGNDLRGEGLLGLARGFLYAGARQVVASLWKVDDRATAVFMQRFYTALLRDKLSAPAALKHAQIEMSQDPAWRSPRYWAGFVLAGDLQ